MTVAIKSLEEVSWIKWLGQIVAYGLFVIFIGTFSNSPSYRHLAQDTATIKLSLRHAGQLLGEGSTSYLPSYRAPQRILELNPEARIVAILRNPVDRAYSAYWHYLASGESCQCFEQHLRYESGLTLVMGEYHRHLQFWLRYFPRNRSDES